jgi:uncharacterized protein YxeA
MKKLLLLVFLIVISNTIAKTKNISAETPFEKELVKYVDSIVTTSRKKIKKLDRFKEGCYSHVKETKFGEAATPYSRSKAHSHNVSFYTDKDGKTNVNLEEFGIESIKKMYSIQIDKILNNPKNIESNFDSYYFTIVNVNKSYFLVFAMGYIDPIDSNERMTEEFNIAMQLGN